MSTMIAEVYEAFKEAGVSEKHAMAASQAIADKESLVTKADLADTKAELKGEIGDLKGDMIALKWMMGFMSAGIASLVVKSFFVIPL